MLRVIESLSVMMVFDPSEYLSVGLKIFFYLPILLYPFVVGKKSHGSGIVHKDIFAGLPKDGDIVSDIGLA